ncbi:hypothetical protein LINGRAHAP2_LOCUS8817 [Linum grandiflorum]
MSCLRRLSCVSKSWNSIFSNPNSIYKTLFTASDNTQLLITIPKINLPKGCLDRLCYDTLLPDDFNLANKDRIALPILCSSAGGLICLQYIEYDPDVHDTVKKVCLFNPATSETKILPPLPQPAGSLDGYCYSKTPSFCTIGLIVMEKDDDDDDDQCFRYKLVCVRQYHFRRLDHIKKIVYVFSSDDESLGWRESPSLDSSSTLKLQHIEVLQYGCTKKKKCYWIARETKRYDHNFNLVSFDPNTDKFSVGKKLPFPGSGSWSCYMVKEETLVVFNKAAQVWVLQQLDVGESWCKLFTTEFSNKRMSRWWWPIGLSMYGYLTRSDGFEEKSQVVDATTGQIPALMVLGATSSSNRTSQYLPEDLIIDIQKRLSLPGLRRLCCVSSSWNSILSNPNFVYKALFDGDNDTQSLITIPKINLPEGIAYPGLPFNTSNENKGKFSPLTLGSCAGGKKLPFPSNGGCSWFYEPSVFMVKEETLVVFNKAAQVWVLQQSDVGESWCKLFTTEFLDDRMSLWWWPVGLSKYALRSSNPTVAAILQPRYLPPLSTQTNVLIFRHGARMSTLDAEAMERELRSMALLADSGDIADPESFPDAQAEDLNLATTHP